MQHQFVAYAVAGELDLNRFAPRFGINRKLRWEEPLLLDPSTMQPLNPDAGYTSQVYLFFFGGVVFLNCTPETIRTFFRDMTTVSEVFAESPALKYQDHYSLRVEKEGSLAISNDFAVLPEASTAFVDIVAFVLAKSVALERIEEQVDTVLDEMEGMITLLDQGKLNIPDRKFAKLASRILNFKYRSIASIMVLDKPDITWYNAEADRFYLTMANLFELNQRYHEIKHKSETLMDITEVFSGLSHAIRASRLEIIIIVLIAIEIVIYLIQILTGKG